MEIRKATVNDAKIIAKLSIEAIGSIANFIANSTEHDVILKSLTNWSQKKGNRISYENTLVGYIENEIIGIIIFYPADDCYKLDKPINDWLKSQSSQNRIEIEAEGNYLYIDTIAIDEKFRGKGFATKLLNAAYEVAIMKKYSGTSLNVDANNEKALKVYQKNGYVISKERYLANKLHYYMVKSKKTS